MADVEALKKLAALKALEHIDSGMLVGLGTGSTAKYFIEGLADKITRAELNDIRAVATSRASEEQAQRLGIPLCELKGQRLDVAVDGMDELDPKLNAIKGLGGALAREKIVESCAELLILIGDESKLVRHIGEKAPIPVEVLPFAYLSTQKRLEALVSKPVLRMKADQAFVTDNGNFIFDCYIDPPVAIYELASALANIPGVVEHGLFLDMAEMAYIATQDDLLSLNKDAV